MNATVTYQDALRRLVAEVKLLTSAEVGERWNQLGAVLSVAEMVLRDGEKQEPVAWMTSKGLYRSHDGIPSRELYPLDKPIPLYAAPAPSPQVVAAVPEGAECHRILKAMAEQVDDWAERLSYDPSQDEISKRCMEFIVHELCAAPQPAAAPSGEVEQYDDSKKDTERLIFAMQDIDGFGGVAWDKYDYAMHFAHCNGRDEPTKEDELVGLRALIDAAITATKEQTMTNEIKTWSERFSAIYPNFPIENVQAYIKAYWMEQEIAELRAKVESLAADAELLSKDNFHADPVEDIAHALAHELEEAELNPNDLVTVNRDKLRSIAKRVLEKATTMAKEKA